MQPRIRYQILLQTTSSDVNAKSALHLHTQGHKSDKRTAQTPRLLMVGSLAGSALLMEGTLDPKTMLWHYCFEWLVMPLVCQVAGDATPAQANNYDAMTLCVLKKWLWRKSVPFDGEELACGPTY